MSVEGLQQARDKMAEAGVDPVAVEVFSHYYRLVESGETGMVPESGIDPLDIPSIEDVELPSPLPTDGLARWCAVIWWKAAVRRPVAFAREPCGRKCPPDIFESAKLVGPAGFEPAT